MTSQLDCIRFDAVMDVAPGLAFSDVRVETRPGINEDADWVGITCPQYPNGIWYRVGPRHHYLMARNGKKWATMRAGTLIRLLVKRLAREVASE